MIENPVAVMMEIHRKAREIGREQLLEERVDQMLMTTWGVYLEEAGIVAVDIKRLLCGLECEFPPRKEISPEEGAAPARP